jgi:UDP-glucose:(heptosyl)LPS alpha-1,3-glucosyltransferase
MFLEKKIYKNPHVRLVAVSNLVARQLETHFDRNDVTVIPNAVDSLRFRTEERFCRREVTRHRFKYSDEDFVLLLIGNDWKNKGLNPLLRAVDLLRDLPLQLLVVGADDPLFFEQWIANLASRDRVRFETPSTDVLAFYAAADAYVGPSLSDAFGLPIVEAMACGLPVIASVHAGASELVRDGETGLLLYDPRNPLEIARLIERLYRDTNLRMKMGLAAADHVQVNCTWEQNVSRTRDFLEMILRERHEARGTPRLPAMPRQQ